MELMSKWIGRRATCKTLVLSNKWSLADVAFDEEISLFGVRISMRHTLVSCTPGSSFTRGYFPASSVIIGQMGRSTSIMKILREIITYR